MPLLAAGGEGDSRRGVYVPPIWRGRWAVGQLTCIHIAKEGYAVYAIDHQGHGRSEGLKGHVPDINAVVGDCIAFFDCKVMFQRESHEVPFFLYGESLGGAIAVLIHLQQPELWQGIILNGAMCGIGKFKPPWPAEHLLSLVAGFIPTWPIVPTKGYSCFLEGAMET